ncbi:hypothetical protein [Neptunomonas japonica]|uniref:Uncharacterized protein n=1 Tax=Neptunomonas japonica JAMM 1380 TaxID=1441457 RepID=A0A7R6SV59_9GAMM|nr:hypothetical protein [Neptunomonas japonica]BBB28380.1 hypothetical protein NEJAP_0422 [Neptunomonas japonica JAMM 1380]
MKVVTSKAVALAALAGVSAFSSLVQAHDETTNTSVQALLAHQLAAPDHVLMFVAGLALVVSGVVYGPGLYRRIRQDKR